MRWKEYRGFRTHGRRRQHPPGVGLGGLLTVELRGPEDQLVPGGTVLVNQNATEENLSAAGLNDSRREAVEKSPGIYVLPRASMCTLKVRVRAPGHAPAEPVMVEMPLEQEDTSQIALLKGSTWRTLNAEERKAGEALKSWNSAFGTAVVAGNAEMEQRLGSWFKAVGQGQTPEAPAEVALPPAAASPDGQ